VLAGLLAAFYGLGFDQRQAVTVSFLTLAFGKLGFAFNLRRPESSLADNEVVKNPYVSGAVGLISFCCWQQFICPAYPACSRLRIRPGRVGWWCST